MNAAPYKLSFVQTPPGVTALCINDDEMWVARYNTLENALTVASLYEILTPEMGKQSLGEIRTDPSWTKVVFLNTSQLEKSGFNRSEPGQRIVVEGQNSHLELARAVAKSAA